MPSFFKQGTDVFQTGVGKINQQQFQDFGLNFDLLSTDPNKPTELGSGRDVETQAFIGAGGQLGQANAAVSSGFTPGSTVPQSFSLNLPSTTSADDLDLAFNTGTNNLDVTKLLSESQGKLQGLISQATEALKPSLQEKQAQERLLGLQQLQEQAVQEVQDRPLSGTVLRAGLAREIQNISTGQTRESLINLREQTFEQQGILLEQNQRQQQFDALKFQIEQEGAQMDNIFKAASLNEEIKSNYINQVSTLSSVARQNLSVLLENFQRLTMDELSPESALQIGQLAAKVGIPLEAISQGMKINKNQIELDNKQQEFENEITREELDIKRLEAQLSGLSGGLPGSTVSPEVQNWVNQISKGNTTIAGVPANLKTSVVNAMEQQGVVTLSDTQRNTIDSVDRSISILNQLEGTLSSLGLAESAAGRFTVGAGLNLGALFKTNENATLYNSQKESLLASLARATGERGVLTDQDVERARKALPSLTDTSSVANGKLEQFKSLMEEFKSRAVKTFTSSFSPGLIDSPILTDGNINLDDLDFIF